MTSILDLAPRVLPPNWCPLPMDFGPDGRVFASMDHRSVIMTVAMYDDGHEWLHVSTAHPTRLPTYAELMEVKDLFVGRDRKAIMVLPSAKEHVNIHPNCLHLFARLDGDSLPDFTMGKGSL